MCRVSGKRLWNADDCLFIDNYDHPIFESDKQLVDMIYFKKICEYNNGVLIQRTIQIVSVFTRFAREYTSRELK